MSDYPDRLAIGKCHPFRGDNFYVSDAGVEKNPAEYHRTDLCVTRSDLDAAVALALEEAAERIDVFEASAREMGEILREAAFCLCAEELRALIQPHQADALARVRQEAHNAAIEAAAKAADHFADTSIVDAAFWRKDAMPKTAEVSEQHAKAARLIAAEVRALALPVDGGAKG